MPPLNRRKNGSLEEARQALADTNGRIEALTLRREGLLIEDDDRAVAAIDDDLDELERLARRDADRVRLLEDQARRHEAEQVAKRNRELIERIEKKLREADDVAVELQNIVGQADKAFRKLITLRTDCASAWPFDSVALSACVLTGTSIRDALQHELYRQGSRPFVGGNESEIVMPALPGARAPDFSAYGQPDTVKPLVDALREANAYASRLMRGAEPPSATPARAAALTGA